jgi:methylated-DNA-[protein]-cysteine S-methyltransferase
MGMVTEHVYDRFASPVGELLAVGDGVRLHGLYMQDGLRPATIDPAWVRDRSPFEPLREQLDEYFAAKRRSFELDLDAAGTPFQLAVWRALAALGYGETVSYRELAARIGRPTASRAVGTANGRNPLSIVIPCHRVIGAGGALTGYAGGLERKRLLLELEGALH